MARGKKRQDAPFTPASVRPEPTVDTFDQPDYVERKPLDEEEPPVLVRPSPPVVKVVPKQEPPLAIAVTPQNKIASAKAIRTCSKYIGGWWHLKEGKLFTAPRDVVVTLQNAGFLDRKNN
jgi:hypothetical protein